MKAILIKILLVSIIPIATFMVLSVNSNADTIVRYVKVGGTGDGTSWATASGTLQAMIDAVEWAGGGTVCVASGTYTPTIEVWGIGNRYQTFQMKNNVGIYGGFPSVGSPSWAERDWGLHITTLSGEIGNPGTISDNCHHVFFHPGTLNTTAILDGCTITGGYADGGGAHRVGGGMFNENSSPQVTNCTFIENSAGWGGGMYNEYSSPMVINCTFCRNESNLGAGMWNSFNSSPHVTNCTFNRNSADPEGGGMFNFDSSPQVTDCTFTENSANQHGGGMVNCHDSSLILTNCTFNGNSAEHGGGMYNNRNSSLQVINCILWGNIASGTGNEIYNTVSYPVVSYSNIQGGYPGIGNISGTPMFVNPGNGDFHLLPNSPCIDSGSNGAILATGVIEDFEGDPRIINGTVDMGVDEYLTWTCLEYDANKNDSIDYPEMVEALMDYLTSELSYAQMVNVLMCYLIS